MDQSPQTRRSAVNKQWEKQQSRRCGHYTIAPIEPHGRFQGIPLMKLRFQVLIACIPSVKDI